MLSGEKILITGPAGNIGFALTKALAQSNEVWGISRFSDRDRRQALEAAGVITRNVDLYDPDFNALPRDFTYVLHVAVTYEKNFDRAFRINGEATGLLLEHCRKAKAALVMSSGSIYMPHPDPFYAYKEDDPLGDPGTHGVSVYPISKMSEEVVARYCARQFNLPVVIARMNMAYSPNGGMPALHADAIIAGKPVVTRSENTAYSIIYDDDVAGTVEALLGAASVPATIVNWGADEVVTTQQWCAYMGELLRLPAQVDVQSVPGGSGGMVFDVSKRRAITGPTKVTWKDGMRRMLAERYPDRTLRA